ncbi:hypothetical protein Droror1_Dr00027404, partial [Drosera rotundifolia]
MVERKDERVRERVEEEEGEESEMGERWPERVVAEGWCGAFCEPVGRDSDGVVL